MKANELSIGDWVCAAGPVIGGEERLTPPMRVVTIDETCVYLEIAPEQGDPFDEEIKDIRPVPLTDAMLLDNGWCPNGPMRFRMETRVNCELKRVVSCEKDNDGYYWTNGWALGYSIAMPIRYVHELQHLLTILGAERDFILYEG